MVSWPNTLLHGRGAAVGLAFYNVLGAIGGFISPYIVGRLSNGGSYNSSMYVQGAFNLAAALMIMGEHISLCRHSVLKCRVSFYPFDMCGQVSCTWSINARCLTPKRG